MTWAVRSGGGSVSSASTTTDATGTARTNWILGEAPGTNIVEATAAGLSGSPVTFTAAARYPYWTVMVYMAADNNLAIEGIMDIDEMEAAGADPEVQVVVQAEFNPDILGLYGCDASCYNRPNFNTFRYAVAGGGESTLGPDGSTIDLGNRDMTSPAELGEFIQWAKDEYPAEHYALVLWNHGGGYTGLLQDATSAGGQMMSIGDLPAALRGVGSIDVLDFDMCLMGGYETLVMIDGLVRYAVFSEEVVPGAGNPYAEILDGLHANPAADPEAVAAIFVDEFHEGYAGDRAPTTKSAYDLTAFAALESELDTLADMLRTNLGSLAPAIESAAAVSQKYTMSELTDIGDFLDSLRIRVSDPTLLAQIDEVKSQVVGPFRVRNRVRNGWDSEERDVSRSTGLSIVLPSGVGDDRMADAGPGSFAAYEALYSGKAWTEFLSDWIAGQAAVIYTDQGTARFEAYLVWDSAAVSRRTDVDLWILEPDGNVYIPYIGSVTPNGTLTNDSWDDGTSYEGLRTNRFVQNGTYRFYANLWTDSADYRPIYDIQYRYDQVSPLSSLYAPNYPRLSTEASWLTDPDPTWGEVDSGAYTDLQLAATWTVGPTAQPTMVPRTGRRIEADIAVMAFDAPAPTAAQLKTIRRLLVERNGIRGSRSSGFGPSRTPERLRIPSTGGR
ncbi:MAG TPA: clostripain-related cysteine peptidase [Longimicrobiales bacterium]